MQYLIIHRLIYIYVILIKRNKWGPIKSSLSLEITSKYLRKSMIIKNRSLWLLTLLRTKRNFHEFPLSFSRISETYWFLWHKGFGIKFYFTFISPLYFYFLSLYTDLRKTRLWISMKYFALREREFFILFKRKCTLPILLGSEDRVSFKSRKKFINHWRRYDCE